MRARRALAAAGLAAFLIAEAWPAPLAPRGRLAKIEALAPLPAAERRLGGTAFFFDPDYGPFLEAVREATPENATIAWKAPATHELYVYTASYLLAPRRLVAWDRMEDAQYAAAYGSDPASGSQIALRGARGSLVRLR